MKKLTPKEREFIEKQLPYWLDALDLVKSGKAEVIIITIRAFDREEAGLLHMALQYAYEEKVQVMFAPLSKEEILRVETKNEKHLN